MKTAVSSPLQAISAKIIRAKKTRPRQLWFVTSSSQISKDRVGTRLDWL